MSQAQDQIVETVENWWERLRELLSFRIFELGETPLTLATVLYLVVFTTLLFVVGGWLKRWLAEGILARAGLQLGVRRSVATLFRYLFTFLGLLIILQTAGIDLTTLTVLAGAIGLGLGFGLQNIVSNFVSGLIILFERPIKVGDRIMVGDVDGRVTEVGARATTVVTNDNIAVIVPNSRFIGEEVVNWSYTDDRVRFKIPVSVAYGSDLELVSRLLVEAAAENPDVLEDPEPSVRFLEFGDSGLYFELRAWSTSRVHQKGKLRSDLNFAIDRKFREHGVEIPFPQRDLHLRGGLTKPQRDEIGGP